MNINAKVAADKAKHPERFCPEPQCLWKTAKLNRETQQYEGGGRCPRHGDGVIKTSADSLMIVANDKNWEPERLYVDEILTKAKAKGLRTDWRYCIAFQDHALGFADDTDVMLVFYLGEFMTEDEYMEKP